MQTRGPRNSEPHEILPNRFPHLSPSILALLAVSAFSLLYFTETAIRASEKRFWYDELCTYYICRLPTFGESWAAVLHGADYNPPLFYVIHRGAMAMFGAGLVTMRLPEIVGFWVLCLSLFTVVSRRAGLLAGTIAMTFPLVTGAYFYAYDARPHGLVLGFCGLAVLCWQRWNEQRRSSLWLLGFGLSLEAAFLTHCYAILLVIPFALVELVIAIHHKAIAWRVWVAIVLPAAIAAISFVPLVRAYKVTLQNAGFGAAFPATIWQIREFYWVTLQSAGLGLVLTGTALLVLDRSFRPESNMREVKVPASESRAEIMLASAFLGMPVYGLLLAKLTNGPFLSRYFLSALLGLCILLAMGLAGGREKWGSLAFLVLLTSSVAYSFTTLVIHRTQGQGEELNEPVALGPLNTDLNDALAIHHLLRSTAGSSLPIVTPQVLDFLYLVHYWAPEVPRLYALSVTSEQLPYKLNRAVREWCHVPFNREETFDQFLPTHPDFFLYGNRETLPLIPFLTRRGGEVRSIKTDPQNRFLAEIHMRNQPTLESIRPKGEQR